MEINYIREFVVLSQIRHFQEAADVLFISQSSLSKHIKAIENELGHDLFIRSKKGIELTNFGKSFLPYATQISNIQQEYTTELLETELTVRKITIGFIPMVTLYTFMKFFSKFAKQHPEYQYNFIQSHPKQLGEWLQQKKVDFILTDEISLPENEYHKILYTSDSLVAVLPSDHPLAYKKHVTIHQLRNENFIQFVNNGSLMRKLQSFYTENHLNIAFQVDKEHMLFDFVERGLGISILTRYAGRHLKIGSVAIVPIYPSQSFDIFMVYLNKNRPTLATKAFIQYLEEKHQTAQVEDFVTELDT